MELSKLASHSGARQVISLVISAWGGLAVLAWLVTSVTDPRTRILTCGVGGGLLLANFVLILLAVGKLIQWELRLDAVALQPGERVLLMKAAGCSMADMGWNRLVVASQHWNALDELEGSLRDSLTQIQTGANAPLLDALADAVAHVDAQGNIRYGNAMLAAMCGAKIASELEGQQLVAVLGGDSLLTEQLASQSQQLHATAEWTMSDGPSPRTLRGTRRVLAANSPAGGVEYVWSIRDVTQQRLADAMRDQFLSAATHEFRTPLANIRAYAESLDLGHDIDAENRKRFYNIIQSESVRLSQLVDDLLDISRMQAGALTLDGRETDLERLVREAAAKVLGQMEERHLQFRCELPPKFPKANVDKSKLTAALVNLLGNAAKYTPDGGRVTFRVDVGPSQVQFSIMDTGIGIAPDELPKIFERFFRSNDDRVRGVTGSGLGLALVQEVARLHGGELAVESVLDQGSTFRLSIPLVSAA